MAEARRSFIHSVTCHESYNGPENRIPRGARFSEAAHQDTTILRTPWEHQHDTARLIQTCGNEILSQEI
jgi:hypothetical protein